MKISLVSTDPANLNVDALAIPDLRRLPDLAAQPDRGLRNAEYGDAGTIMGGMFIAEFAGGKPWAHIDIAAASWNTNLQLTTVLHGPSGAGTRLCIELAELMARPSTASWPPPSAPERAGLAER